MSKKLYGNTIGNNFDKLQQILSDENESTGYKKFFYSPSLNEKTRSKDLLSYEHRRSNLLIDTDRIKKVGS